MTDETIRTLRLAGRRRASVERQRSKASSALSDAVRAAKEAGMTPTNIAKEAGVSRQTVHEMLKEALKP